MAETFDAASRLAEGRPAADDIQNYVWACHLLGYQDPDLTLHASQVRDWYGSEDGIDLHALDADCAALRAASVATDEALSRQDAQVAAMSIAWQGHGADASRSFLRRHGEASAAAAAAVRTAAESLAALRDRLWRTIDGKVAATAAAEGRGERPEWQAAAQTVTTGVGDRATASELIDQEVKPFVDSDIRATWLAAMRSAVEAVTDAYDVATAELTSEADAAFDVPGDFGPSWTPSPQPDAVATTPAAAFAAPAPVDTAPMAWAPPSAPQPMTAPATEALPLPPAAPLPPPVDPAAMAPPALPSVGGGLPEIGSGLSGFGQQLGDILGGLLGSADDALPDQSGIDELPDLDEPDDLDDDDLDEPDGDAEDPDGDADDPDDADPDDTASEDEPVPAPDAACEPKMAAAQPVPGPIEPPALAEPAPTPAPVPAPIPPPDPAPPAPMSATETPCEIAADELPQVGQ